MAHDPSVNRFLIGEIPVAAVDMGGMIQSVRRYLALGPRAAGGYIAFCSAHGVVESERDSRVADAHRSAWLVVADGRPLFWFGRLRGIEGIGQVPGIDSVEEVCRAGVQAGWRHFFLGGGPGVAQSLAETMVRRVPGLQVAGCEMPPFRDLTAEEKFALRSRLRACRAQIVWVGLGAPKQDLFMAEHAPHLPGMLLMGVGAAFDVNTGRLSRAPKVMRSIGLEWAYRLATEPARLWSRYSVVVPQFLLIAARSLGAADRAEVLRRLLIGRPRLKM